MQKTTLAELAGLMALLSCYATFVLLFLTAYFFGNYRVLATINDYGEAHIELIALLASFPLVLLFTKRKLVEYAHKV